MLGGEDNNFRRLEVKKATARVAFLFIGVGNVDKNPGSGFAGHREAMRLLNSRSPSITLADKSADGGDEPRYMRAHRATLTDTP